MSDSYIYVITALLPLSALMLVVQTNPYNALVVQGILGAVAALVFAVLGAADVALTQALMGTLLAITLYAIAVRSSLVMRLGVLEDGAIEADDESVPDGKAVSAATPQKCDHFKQLMDELRIIFGKHYLRLELISYTNMQALHQALMDQEVHATCTRFAITPLSPPLVGKTISLPEVQGGLEWGQSQISHQDLVVNDNEKQPYQTAIRVKRIYEIMQTELTSPMTSLTYVSTTDSGEKHT